MSDKVIEVNESKQFERTLGQPMPFPQHTQQAEYCHFKTKTYGFN